MRDRAVDLLAEEDDLAKALASTWERDPDKPFPRLHADPSRILAGGSGRRGPSTRHRSRRTPRWCRPRVGVRSSATARRSSMRLTQLLADGYRVVVAADGEGSADRLAALLRDHGLDLPVHHDGTGDLTRPGRPHRRRPAAHGGHAAGGPAGDRRRERPHRSPPRPSPAAAPPARHVGLLRGPQARQLRRPRAARRRPLRGHGQADDRRRRARLPAGRLQGRRQAVRPVGPDRRAAPVRRGARRRRCTASAAATSPRPRAGSARPCGRSPRSSSSCTRSASTPRASPSARTRRGSTRWRTPSRTSRRPTSASPSTTSRPTWSGRTRWTA